MRKIIKQIEEYEKRTRQFAHLLVKERMAISTALREERLSMRISLRSAAKQLGISAPYLSDIELGRRNISISFYRRLKKTKLL